MTNNKTTAICDNTRPTELLIDGALRAGKSLDGEGQGIWRRSRNEHKDTWLLTNHSSCTAVSQCA